MIHSAAARRHFTALLYLLLTVAFLAAFAGLARAEVKI